ncbi:MAG: hypothetical protein H6604_05855 [Flavobacteriales bacterium]|nr:hypothetical protein [Flavobacteriales bacterium]
MGRINESEDNIIIDQELSNQIKDILLETKTFSNLGLYLDRIDKLITDLDAVTNKTKNEVHRFLNEWYHLILFLYFPKLNFWEVQE